MVDAYLELHRLGYAHSFESWEGDTLVGGLYGVSLGAAFFGESMFADAPDASKVAFVLSVEWLRARGITLIDCQVRTEHLVRFGAREIPRAWFLSRLAAALERPTLVAPSAPRGGSGRKDLPRWRGKSAPGLR
jgi:leucyl/phenylalanyl-tRNA--protein transferase